MSPNTPDVERPHTNGSTGPITPEGKARSAANSYKHGATSVHDVIEEQDRPRYEELREDLLKRIQPRDALEGVAFDSLLHSSWSMFRIRRMEEAYFNRGPEELEKAEVRKALELLHRYHVRHERTYYKARKELEELQTAAAVRFTIPKDAQHAFAPMANTMKIHAAKRTGEKVWTKEDRESLRRHAAAAEAARNQKAAESPTPEANPSQN